MFPSPVRSGLTLSKVIGGVSKTLNVANQIIPLYMQAKPMISNARNAFKIAKGILKKDFKFTQNTSNQIINDLCTTCKHVFYVSNIA